VKDYMLALDQGTTSSRALVFDRAGRVVSSAQQEFAQIYPHPGWVEQDPLEIWATQRGVMSEALDRVDIAPVQIAAIGITNQRETTIMWDRKTGRPVYNAIVWQSRQTASICDRLRADPELVEMIPVKTGLLIYAYFSATKIMWLLEQVDGLRERAEAGEIAFGTVDTWLLWKLTDGQCHITDYSNASRTMLYNIEQQCWDDDLLERLAIPRAILPEVKSSSEVYAEAPLGQVMTPVAGIAGDQQSALFGQACFTPGMAKVTYGTGAFLLLHTGTTMPRPGHGLLATIAWGIDGQVEYALEGSVFVAGAAVQWLRDEIGLIHDASDTAYFAEKVADNNGVYFVPAFTGLGAPYWDMHARGAIVGLTRGANRNHIIRATLEAIAYQSRDVLDAMSQHAGLALKELRVDGGAAANDFLLQFQADILDSPVVRPQTLETTAFGAACLAGLAVGFWPDRKTLASQWRAAQRFDPAMDDDCRHRLYKGWTRAVKQCRDGC